MISLRIIATPAAPGCVPYEAMSATLALLIAAGVLVAALSISLSWRTASQAGHALRTLRLLHAASTPLRASGLGLVDSDAAVACATGLLEPRLFLSRGLWRRLDLTELKIVLRHERAHLTRHDHHMRLVAAVVSLGHWPKVAKRLFGELVLAQEQACDRVAAKYYGVLRTAETVLKVERMGRDRVAAATTSMAFADAPVEARIEALLEPHFRSSMASAALLIGATVMAAAGVALGIEPLHHAVETLVVQTHG